MLEGLVSRLLFHSAFASAWPMVPVSTRSELGIALSRLRQAQSRALEIAVQIERGQALTSLQDHLNAVGVESERHRLVILLLGLDEASRAASIGWVCGRGIAGHQRLDHSSDVELLVIGLVETGMGSQIGHGGCAASSADSAQGVGRRVSEEDHAGRRGVTIEVGVGDPLCGVEVWVPRSVGVLSQNGALLSQVLVEAHLLIVAGPSRLELDAGAADVLRDLGEGLVPVAAVVCGPAVGLARGGDWIELVGARPLAGNLTRSVPAPAILQGTGDSWAQLRGALLGTRHAARLKSAVALMADLVDREIRQLEARKTVLQRRAADLAERQRDKSLRDAEERIRREVNERLGVAEAGLAQRQRARVGPGSARLNRLNNHLEDLTGDAIAEQTAGHVIRLGLRIEPLTAALRLVREAAREDVDFDHAEVQEQLDEAIAAASDELKAATGEEERHAAPLLDKAATWSSLEKLIQLDFRSEGEALHRGWLDLISHGRRPVVVTGMVFSMLGAAFGVGGHYGPLLAVLLLVLFLGSLAWAWHEFRQERRAGVERELRRVREGLRRELGRVYEMVLREWQGCLIRHLRESNKAVIRQTDARLRAASAKQSRAIERENEDVQEKHRHIEQRLRDLGVSQQQLMRMRMTVEESTRALDDVATAALEPLWAAGVRLGP